MSSLFYFLSFLLEIYKVYWSFQRTKFLFIDSLFLVSLISVFYFFPFLICVYFALCFLISCDDSLVYWFETFLHSSSSATNFPFSSPLSHSQILMFYSIFFSIRLWPVDYVEVCCLVSKCLNVFTLPFCCWFLVWLHCGHRTFSIWFQTF